ncbi:carboxypeptidase B-like [Toxorhynchites rutilus septentrionalis]|uniref:carboxypeptidase B-like n=1 Tax=Toxorhynchites rutilus septentrionalis TaxID=329112 RepID=UPI00247AAE88|nr:carboxypeptidase B-like [Toxorhynchites rutilus septentrionalis]
MKFILALTTLALVVAAEQVSYKNYKVYDIQVTSDEQRTLLKNWQLVDGVDFWNHLGNQIMVRPETQEELEKFLTEHGFDYKVLIQDVQMTIDAEQRYDLQYRRAKLFSRRSSVDFIHFWRTQEIYDYLDELAAKYPNLVRVSDIGHTHQNRTIKAIKISTSHGSDSKPVIFIDGGVHAREWGGIMSVVYLIHELVEHSEQYSNMLEKDWVIVPVANPDGYEHSHSTNRLWRKNRNPVNILCIGTDLNRNFDYQWAPGRIACSETFPGSAPNSELETQALTKLMSRYENNLKLYLAVHTYGELILYPFGYEWPFIPVSNQAEHVAIGERARAAVLAIGGPDYLVGNSAEVLYTANGASDDYAVGVGGAAYAFTLELSGGGVFGFDLPATQIEQVARETFEIFKSMAGDI